MSSVPPQPSVHAEDFTIGQVHELGQYTVSKEELVDFARRWDQQWFHVDEEAARGGYYQGLIASGIHTMAIMQRLLTRTVFDSWAVVAGLGFDRVRFPAPVRPGDVLTGALEIVDVTLDGLRGRVKMDLRLANQDDHTALYADLTIVMWRKPGAAAGLS